MFKSTLYPDSGEKLVLDYLSKQDRGSIFSVSDFLKIKGITYTAIRTVLVILCKKNVLVRICRGIYCFPVIDDNIQKLPSLDIMLSEIARINGYSFCPAGDYAQFLIGIIKICPKNITCYTSGKVKTINFQNRINAKMIPSRKVNLFKISSRKLMIASSFILERKGNLTNKEINCIRNYIDDVPSEVINENSYLLSPSIINVINK